MKNCAILLAAGHSTRMHGKDKLTFELSGKMIIEYSVEALFKHKLIDHVNKLCVNDHSCPNIISQYAGLEALKGSKDAIEKIVTIIFVCKSLFLLMVHHQII